MFIHMMGISDTYLQNIKKSFRARNESCCVLRSREPHCGRVPFGSVPLPPPPRYLRCKTWASQARAGRAPPVACGGCAAAAREKARGPTRTGGARESPLLPKRRRAQPPLVSQPRATRGVHRRRSPLAPPPTLVAGAREVAAYGHRWSAAAGDGPPIPSAATASRCSAARAEPRGPPPRTAAPNSDAPPRGPCRQRRPRAKAAGRRRTAGSRCCRRCAPACLEKTTGCKSAPGPCLPRWRAAPTPHPCCRAATGTRRPAGTPQRHEERTGRTRAATTTAAYER
mmetsp:Transcript_27380/g.89601  ORF Transcript_27380/g.89601 Transcript_27380/m.89601 type:complete len:283 (-) Transcript_27380:106-954(-)